MKYLLCAWYAHGWRKSTFSRRFRWWTRCATDSPSRRRRLSGSLSRNRNNAAGFHAATIVGLSRKTVGVGLPTVKIDGLTVGGSG